MATLTTTSQFDDTHGHRALVVVIALVIAMFVLLAAQGSTSHAASVFVSATAQYADLHRRVETALGPIAVTREPDEINRQLHRLAVAIRDARPGAVEGDLFTPALAREIRQQLAEALVANKLTPADMRAMQAGEGAAAAQPTLTVNGRYPWAFGAAMLPSLIDVLPPLPPELQYR